MTLSVDAVPGIRESLRSDPAETVASVKQDLLERHDPAKPVTVVARLRSTDALDDRLATTSGDGDRLEESQSALVESAHSQAESLKSSLENGMTPRDDLRFLALPYMHSALFELRGGDLLEWLADDGVDLLCGLSLNEPLPTQRVPSPQTTAKAALRSSQPAVPWWMRATRLDELHQLGHTANGQVLGVLDSGVDGASAGLRSRIADFLEVDAAGQLNQSATPNDSGCHGTKINGLLVGGNESVAPGGSVLVSRVLDGPVLRESGTLAQITAGANWLAQSAKTHGVSVANIAIEFMTHDPRLTKLQQSLRMLEFFGIKPVLAVGNAGSGSRTLVRGIGLAVGSVDSANRVSAFSSDEPDIVAPGEGLTCLQPRLPALGNTPSGVYSGTSLSVAIVAGTLAVLHEATGRNVDDCANAVLQAARNRSGRTQRHLREGWGPLDAREAFDLLQANSGPIPPP